jgi:hypothetical protein
MKMLLVRVRVPSILEAHSFCDEENDTPKRMSPQDQHWRSDLDKLQDRSDCTPECSFQQIPLRLLGAAQLELGLDPGVYLLELERPGDAIGSS